MADENVQEKLDNANPKDGSLVAGRDALLDVATPIAVTQGLQSLGKKIIGRVNIDRLKHGKDTSLGHKNSLAGNVEKKSDELKELMVQNKNAAKEANDTKNIASPLMVIMNNFRKEAEIGPLVDKDIEKILKEDAGLNPSKVDRAIKRWYNKNKDSGNVAKLIEAKDPDVTWGHSLRVSETTYQVAKKYGLNEKEAQKLADAALLHDIGKVQVPEAALNTEANFKEDQFKHLKKWLDDHDIRGAEILSSTPYEAEIAKGHHWTHGHSDKSTNSGLVSISDIYDATVSPRSYKSKMSVDKALNSEKGIRWNINQGEITEDYLDLIKALEKDGLLKDYYKIESPLRDAYKSMKANAIKSKVMKDYETSNDKTLGAILEAMFMRQHFTKNLDKGGIKPTNAPTASEVLSSASPSYRSKTDKVNEIKKWYEKGYSNNEIDKLIVETDFNNNKDVTKLWKVMNDYINSLD